MISEVARLFIVVHSKISVLKKTLLSGTEGNKGCKNFQTPQYLTNIDNCDQETKKGLNEPTTAKNPFYQNINKPDKPAFYLRSKLFIWCMRTIR